MSEQPTVKMYTLSTCSHCKAAKKFMGELDVEFEFTDVDLLEGMDKVKAVNAMRKVNPSLSFPTIIIGEKVIVGNRNQEIKEALGLS
jgi:glutaredoxin